MALDLISNFILIALTGIFRTNLFIGIEPKKRAKYLMPSGIIIMIRGGQNN